MLRRRQGGRGRRAERGLRPTGCPGPRPLSLLLGHRPSRTAEEEARRLYYIYEALSIPDRADIDSATDLHLSPLLPFAANFSLVARVASPNCCREREKEWVGRACGFTRIPPLLESHRGDLLLGSAFLEIGPSSVSETFSIPWRRKSWNIACNLFFVRSPFHSPLLFSPRARFGSLSSLGDKKTSFSYELDVPLNYRVAPPYLTLVLRGSLSL